ncbi:MAG: nucleotidyl transferase AbiEii/AbiGii toxin family protein [Chitinophagaceae bacterium]|nr:nucleotidyl transferase AbiEii/AbiGii toxin family protein [Chitinophagaceae bacterium]
MIKWLELPDSEKLIAYEQIGLRAGRSPFIIEKDWWVVQTLSIIFDLPVGQYLVFKGGTSLSKAWQLIGRFSEDVDLAVDREFLGFSGELNKTQRTKLRKAAGIYITDKFSKDLALGFKQRGIKNIDIEIVEAPTKDQDPRIINIHYPGMINTPGYILPRVQIEIGCRSLREPFSIRTFNSLVDEYYPDKNMVQPAIHIPSVDPGRTFLEKLFLLHEEFQRPVEKVRVNRLSRHLYDISKLAKSHHAEKALQDPDLYEMIVAHRYRYTRVGGVDYNLHQPQSLSPMPPESLMKGWRDDYQEMLEQMIYEPNAPAFDILIKDIDDLRSKINAIPWKFRTIFSAEEQ